MIATQYYWPIKTQLCGKRLNHDGWLSYLFALHADRLTKPSFVIWTSFGLKFFIFTQIFNFQFIYFRPVSVALRRVKFSFVRNVRKIISRFILIPNIDTYKLFLAKPILLIIVGDQLYFTEWQMNWLHSGMFTQKMYYSILLVRLIFLAYQTIVDVGKCRCARAARAPSPPTPRPHARLSTMRSQNSYRKLTDWNTTFFFFPRVKCSSRLSWNQIFKALPALIEHYV